MYIGHQATSLYNYNYENWKNNMNSYSQEKKNLEWGHNIKPIVITKKMMIESENIINPVTQKYTSEKLQQKINFKEKENQINSMTRSYDKALRNEQTYDIINLKDKLAGFERNTDYPQMSQIRNKKLETSQTNYNILSNITLDKHHYLPAELRPKMIEDRNEIKLMKINAVDYKDYDIITNKYKFKHEEKTKTDYDLTVVEAAKNFSKKRNFDPIKISNIDGKKEASYQNYRKEKESKRIADAFENSSEVCNYVYNVVIDKDKLNKLENKEKNKRKRYTLKRDIENYYANRNSQEFIKDKQSIGKKMSYGRYKNIDERGYDILNLENSQKSLNSHPNLKRLKQPWENLLEKLGDNQTVNDEEIYKNPYDTNDHKKTLKVFKNIREKKIELLPSITEDSQYRSININATKNTSSKSPKRKQESKNLTIEKELWFAKNKNLDSSIKVEKETLVIPLSPKAKTRILRNSLAL